MSVLSEPDERRYIRIQLHPVGDRKATLPEGVSLSMHTAAGVLHQICAGDRDNYIQIPPFRTLSDQAFTVVVSYAQQSNSIEFTS